MRWMPHCGDTLLRVRDIPQYKRRKSRRAIIVLCFLSVLAWLIPNYTHSEDRHSRNILNVSVVRSQFCQLSDLAS